MTLKEVLNVFDDYLYISDMITSIEYNDGVNSFIIKLGYYDDINKVLSEVSAYLFDDGTIFFEDIKTTYYEDDSNEVESEVNSSMIKKLSGMIDLWEKACLKEKNKDE